MSKVLQIETHRQDEREATAAFRKWWEQDVGDFSPIVNRSVRLFTRRLGIEEVYEALQIAVAFSERQGGAAVDDVWRYFCGVCWGKIRDQDVGGVP